MCYSCLYYSECNVKTGTCQKCDKYQNKAEAEKTDEQRYSEEQDRIDRETKAKLRQQADNEKMEHLPSDAAKQPKVHRIRLNRNGVMDIWNMAHVEDGEKYYIRKEYTEVSELQKGNEPQVVIQQVPQAGEQNPQPEAGETQDGQTEKEGVNNAS